MVTPSSPLGFVEALLERASGALRPPPWAVHELQHRAVLLLNHVLQQEPEAQERLARQRGRVAVFGWRSFQLRLIATPAGLLDLAPQEATADLSVVVTEISPLTLASMALRGDKPSVQIEGDVQLAAEVNWLVDHVRWNAEEDLARLLGDAPAHVLGTTARRATEALRQFVRRAGRDPMPSGTE